MEILSSLLPQQPCDLHGLFQEKSAFHIFFNGLHLVLTCLKHGCVDHELPQWQKENVRTGKARCHCTGLLSWDGTPVAPSMAHPVNTLLSGTHSVDKCVQKHLTRKCSLWARTAHVLVPARGAKHWGAQCASHQAKLTFSH